MSLLEKFQALIHKPIKPKGEDTEPEDDETLTAAEKRQLAHMRREAMRRDLMGAGYGGIQRNPRGLLTRILPWIEG